MESICNFLKGESNRAHWSDVNEGLRMWNSKAWSHVDIQRKEQSWPQEKDVQQFYHGSMPAKLRNIKEDKCDEG